MKLSKLNRKEPENVEKDWPSEFRIFKFFWIYFQFLMIEFGRTELKLRASFAFKFIESMLYLGK